jgi:hypothetical protein
MKKFWRILLIVLVLVGCMSMTACMLPYDKPEFVTIEASQTAFLIPLVGDEANQAVFESEDLLESAKVATKEVQITHRWVKTDRWKTSGEYRANVKLIIVERKPETREWTADKATGSSAVNQAVYAESKESIGFYVGMNCSAQIDEENATKFLYRYNNKPLSEIMDTEIRARVESDFVEQCAKYTLEELLINKELIMDAVRDDVTSYFAERGITVTVLGMKEGLTYEDDKIQQAINDKYSSQQKIVTAKNDAESVKITAQGKADAMLIEAQAQADANKLLSASITQQLIDKTLADNWDGKLPIVQGSGGNILDLGNVLGTESK